MEKMPYRSELDAMMLDSEFIGSVSADVVSTDWREPMHDRCSRC